MASKSSPSRVIPKNRFAAIRMASLNDPEKQSLLQLAFAILQDLHQPGLELPSPNHTRDYLRMLLAERKAEVFGCVYLDNRHRVIEAAELFQGTIDGASVYPPRGGTTGADAQRGSGDVFSQSPEWCRRAQSRGRSDYPAIKRCAGTR